MEKKSIGNRIKNIRKKLGINQTDFGNLIDDAHKSVVSKWEKGQNLPNNERLKKIADLGNISIEELLYGSLDEYARTLLDNLENELSEDKSISDNVIPQIVADVKNRLFPKYFHTTYTNRDDLEKAFVEFKKDAIKTWTDYERIDLEIASRIRSQISSDIYDNLKYFYITTYETDGKKGEKVSARAEDIVKRLEKLDRFQRAYIDGLRYLDNKKIAKELNKIDSYTDKLNTTIIL